MHKKYKEYVEQQHAPKDLVQNTLEQMKGMQEKPSYTTKAQWGKFAAAAACICGVFVVGSQVFTGAKVTYYQMNGTEIVENFGTTAAAKKSITTEEYDSMFGTKTSSLKTLSGWTVAEEESFVSYEDGLTWGSEEQEIVSDGCRIVLKKDDTEMVIQVSKNEVTAPSVLLQQKAGKILKTEVYLGYDKEQNVYYGTFMEGECSYTIKGKGLTEKEMTDFIKETLKTVQ